MSGQDEIRHKFIIWSSILSLLIVTASALWLHYKRTDLSADVYDQSMSECVDATSPEACRQRVDDYHDDCYRWSLTRHDERPEVDREQYRGCLEHPPGKFRKSSN